MFGGLLKGKVSILIAGRVTLSACAKVVLHSLRKAAKGFCEFTDVGSLFLSACQIFKSGVHFNLESVAYLCMDAIGYENKNNFFRKMFKLRRLAR